MIEFWTHWMFDISVQLAILVLLIGIITLLGHRLSARLRYMLWLLVLLKALLPPFWAVPWSVVNQTAQSLQYVFVQKEIPVVREYQSRINQSRDHTGAIPHLSFQYDHNSEDGSDTSFDCRIVLFALWFGGAMLFWGVVLYNYGQAMGVLKKGNCLEKGPIVNLLYKLKLRLNMKTAPQIILSDSVSSPFLYGLFAPKIAVPADFPGEVGSDEMESVLLHELTHWKRGDLFVVRLELLIQGIFWFHPLVWLAIRQLRYERESACDEAVLDTGCIVADRYGNSLLNVLDAVRGRSPVPIGFLGFLGILERKTQLQQRLEEIMLQQNHVKKIGTFDWGFLLFLSLCVLPMAVAQNETEKPKAVDQSAETQNVEKSKLKKIKILESQLANLTFDDTKIETNKVVENKTEPIQPEKIEPKGLENATDKPQWMVLYNQGVTFAEKRKYREAIEADIAALKLNPENDRAWGNLLAYINNWSIDRSSKNRYDQAAQILDYGIALDNSYEKFHKSKLLVYFFWIRLQIEEGKVDKVLQEKALQLFQNADPSFRNNTAVKNLINIIQKEKIEPPQSNILEKDGGLATPGGQSVSGFTHQGDPNFVLDVRITGNLQIGAEDIFKIVKIRQGQPFSESAIEEDKRALIQKGWFIDVKLKIEKTSSGHIVTFQFTERPIVHYVKIVGNKAHTRKILLEEANLKPGDALDPTAVQQAKERMEQFYRNSGYDRVHIAILSGDQIGDRGAVFLVSEGTK